MCTNARIFVRDQQHTRVGCGAHYTFIVAAAAAATAPHTTRIQLNIYDKMLLSMSIQSAAPRTDCVRVDPGQIAMRKFIS